MLSNYSLSRTLLLFAIITGCQGVTSKHRSDGSDPSADASAETLSNESRFGDTETSSVPVPINGMNLADFELKVAKLTAAHAQSGNFVTTINAQVVNKSTGLPATSIDSGLSTLVTVSRVDKDGKITSIPSVNGANGLWSKAFVAVDSVGTKYVGAWEVKDKVNGKILHNKQANSQSEVIDPAIYFGLLSQKTCVNCTGDTFVAKSLTGMKVGLNGLETLPTEDLGTYLQGQNFGGVIFPSNDGGFRFFVQTGPSNIDPGYKDEVYGYDWNGFDKFKKLNKPIIATEERSVADFAITSNRNNGYSFAVVTKHPTSSIENLSIGAVQPNMENISTSTVSNLSGTPSVLSRLKIGGIALSSDSSFLNFEVLKQTGPTEGNLLISDHFSYFSGRKPEIELVDNYTSNSTMNSVMMGRSGEAVSLGDSLGNICFVNSNPGSFSARVQLLCTTLNGVTKVLGEISVPGFVIAKPRIVADWLGQKMYIVLAGMANGQGFASLYTFEDGRFGPSESLKQHLPASFMGNSADFIIPIIDTFNFPVLLAVGRNQQETTVSVITRVETNDFKTVKYVLDGAVDSEARLTSNAALRQARHQGIAPSELSYLPR